MTLILVFVSLVLLLVILLLIPVEISLCLQREEESSRSLRLSWLYGLVRVGPGKPSKRREKAGRRAGKAKRRSRKRSFQRLQRVLRTKGLAASFLKMTARLRRAIRVRQGSVRTQIGFADPADTGIFCALAFPLLALWTPPERLEISMEPDFQQPQWRYQCLLDLSLVPLRLILPVLLFVLSPVGLRTFRRLATGGGG